MSRCVDRDRRTTARARAVLLSLGMKAKSQLDPPESSAGPGARVPVTQTLGVQKPLLRWPFLTASVPVSGCGRSWKPCLSI